MSYLFYNFAILCSFLINTTNIIMIYDLYFLSFENT